METLESLAISDNLDSRACGTEIRGVRGGKEAR